MAVGVGGRKEFLTSFVSVLFNRKLDPKCCTSTKHQHARSRKNQKGINYVWLNKHKSTVEQPVNGEGRERQWSKVMCNLTSQWTVGRPGRPIAGGVREINSRVSSSKIWLIPSSVHCWRCSGCSWSGQPSHRGKIRADRNGAKRAKRRTNSHPSGNAEPWRVSQTEVFLSCSLSTV